MKQKIFNYDFSEETEYIVAFFSVIIFLIWGNYSRPILNLDFLKIILTEKTILSFIAIVILQINSIKQAIIKHDYIKYCRKIVISGIVCISIGLVFNFPFLYKTIKYAEHRTDEKVTLNASFKYRKGRAASQFVEFIFKGRHQSISISTNTTNRLIEYQKNNTPFCVLLRYRRGLENTFVLKELKIRSCN